MTQKHVAEAAGVSQMTVSNALRGSEMVSRETRQRVLKVATSLGYRPNSSAVAIRRGRLGCVAIIESVMPYRSSFFGGALFDGIESVLSAQDIHISVVRMPDRSLTDSRTMPKILREYMADGLLINYFADIPRRLVELLDRYRIPAVWINSKQTQNCVYLDDYRGGREATQYLIDLGHRDIAYADYVNLRPASQKLEDALHYSIADRLIGYRDAMQAAGLTPRVVHDGERSLGRDTALAAARTLLAGPDRPTAVVSYSGSISLQLTQAATELGMRLGEDLSLVTFEDWRDAAENGIRYTTMRHHWKKIGAAASQMLLDRLENDKADRPPQVLSFELVEGETCGRPPRRRQTGRGRVT